MNEKEKYEHLWNLDWYRKNSPGFHSPLFEAALLEMRNNPGRILDIGCGNGQVLASLLEEGFDAYGVDIADNCLNKDLKKRIQDRFTVLDVCDTLAFEDYLGDIGIPDYILCFDMLEHLPFSGVSSVLTCLSDWLTEVGYFDICMQPNAFADNFIEGKAHLTIAELSVWEKWFKEFGFEILYSAERQRPSGNAVTEIVVRPGGFRF